MTTSPIKTHSELLDLSDVVQKMSMQWIDFDRTLRYLKSNGDVSKESSLGKIIGAIVVKYAEIHTQNESGFKYFKCTDNAKSTLRSLGFKLKIYARNISAKPRLLTQVNKMKEGDQKINTKKGSEFLLFFIKICEKEIVVLSSGQAWNVVRPCIRYDYPIKIAELILDAEKIVKIKRRCLVGPNLRETILEPPSGELYKTTSLYYLVESIQCVVKKNASLMNIDPFIKVKGELKINITSGGLLRIQKEMAIRDYPAIISLFYCYTHGLETYSQDGKVESRDPQFEFLHFLQPAQICGDILDEQLIEQAINFYRGSDDVHPVFFRHKFLSDFLDSTCFEFQYKPKAHFQILSDSPPTLVEVIVAVSNFLGGKPDKASLARALQKVRFRYTHPQTNQMIPSSLIECFEGEVRYEDRAYFKVRNMWYQLSADFNALLREDFKSLLCNRLLEPQEEGHLPLPWKGNKRQDVLTQQKIKEVTGITKGIQEFMSRLKEAKVCFVSEQWVSFHGLTIEQLVVHQSVLVGEILNVEVIFKNKEKIEKILFAKSEISLETRLKNSFPDHYQQILSELQVQRSILKIETKGKKKNLLVLNPFAYPLKEACKTNFKKFETLLQEVHHNDKKEDEATYNRQYLYDKMNNGKLFGPEEGFLVFDCILPNNIEVCDIVKFTKKTTYLYHVKEDFGQNTRDACSQILNSAKILRSALSTHQPKNFLQMLWEEATLGEKKGWRKQSKEQLEYLGKQKFFDIFCGRRIVFVYACLEKENHSFHDEIAMPTRLSPEHLKGTSQKKQFQELKTEEFLDSSNRLTGKFYESSQKSFQLEKFKKESSAIYSQLSKFKSVSASTLAKLELIHAARELHTLNFEFKICEIKRPNSSSAAQEGASLADTLTYADIEELLSEETTLSEHSDISEGIDRGFINIGNSCYMNATLQVLFSIKEITDLIEAHSKTFPTLNHLYRKRGIHELKNLRTKVFQTKGKGVLTGSIKGQQDAHEFLVFILDKIGWHPIETYSNFSYMFEGREKNHNSESEDPTHHLSLAITKNQNFQTTLNAYFARETLEGKRETKIDGKKYMLQHAKALRITELPTILVIHLKKFTQFGEKITFPINFPTNEIVTIKQRNRDSETHYQIFGYINHHGSTVQSGHYTADIKNLDVPDGKGCWVRYNDDSVNFNPSLKPEMDAYIVFLKKLPNPINRIR